METTLQPDALRDIFAANVKARRKELGLTQADLAKRIDSHQPYIAAMERAAFSPTTDMLAKLGEALQIAPDALLRPGIFSSTPS